MAAWAPHLMQSRWQDIRLFLESYIAYHEKIYYWNNATAMLGNLKAANVDVLYVAVQQWVLVLWLILRHLQALSGTKTTTDF